MLCQMEFTPPQKCKTGNDPFTNAPWVVCSANAMQAWISAQSGGGTYTPLAICQSLGYSQVGPYGGNCNNVCGYCQGGTSCMNNGSMTFDMGGKSCGVDKLCITVHWICLK